MALHRKQRQALLELAGRADPRHPRLHPQTLEALERRGLVERDAAGRPQLTPIGVHAVELLTGGPR